jgi:hypothetical protein
MGEIQKQHAENSENPQFSWESEFYPVPLLHGVSFSDFAM